jgi:hypothetical protein
VFFFTFGMAKTVSNVRVCTVAKAIFAIHTVHRTEQYLFSLDPREL